jgi:hypothetical protein
MTRHHARILATASIAFASLLAGCSDDHDHDGEEPHDIDAEACEHFAAGPYATTTATSDPSSAPDVNAEHTAHQITLPAASGGSGGGGGGGGADATGDFSGYVSFNAAAAGDYVFMLDQDVPLAVEDSSGASVAIEASCDPNACSTSCASLRGRHTVELGVGSHRLRLGPSDTSSLQLVHERLGAHAD